MRVINPPGGKSNINLFEEEPEQVSQRVVNKCQEERMKSTIFSTEQQTRPDADSEKEREEQMERISNKTPSPTKSPHKTESTIFPCAWYPEKHQTKRQSPYAIRNNQSNIF